MMVIVTVLWDISSNMAALGGGCRGKWAEVYENWVPMLAKDIHNEKKLHLQSLRIIDPAGWQCQDGQ